MVTTTKPFEGSHEPPPVGNTTFVFDLDQWETVRDSGISPLNQSELSTDIFKRREYLSGAQALGLIGRSKHLMPQQYRLADVCNVDLPFIGVLLPRRSSKTTSLFALAIGRCLGREDYLVAYTTATTGSKARDRFHKDITPILERVFPDEATRPFKIRRAAGQERLIFDNGSIFQVLPPQGESFRSDAFDLVIIDEAGEASPDMGEDLLQGILPTLDTRPNAQVIVAGTAAKYRDGNLLWDTLADGRASVKGTGIIEYAAPDETNLDTLETWEDAIPLVLAAHPGVGTLTTLDRVEVNFNKLSREQFAEEYLSLFGNNGATASFLDQTLWGIARRDGDLPKPPESFALALAVHPDGIAASIVAAWREDGKAHVLVLDNRLRTDWVSTEAHRLSKKYRTDIVLDSQSGATTVIAEELRHMKPSARQAPQTWGNVSTAASLFTTELTGSRIVHYGQPALDEAVRVAVKRGSASSSRWAFGRPPKDMGADITSLEAAAMALRRYDEKPAKRRYKAIVE